MGSTARTVVVEAPGAVLLLQHEDKVKRPILLTYGSSTAAKRVLAIVVRLMPTLEPTDRSPLTVLILTGAEALALAQHLEQEASTWLQKHRLQANYQRMA